MDFHLLQEFGGVVFAPFGGEAAVEGAVEESLEKGF